MKAVERKRMIDRARRMARLLYRTGTPRIGKLLRGLSDQVEYLEGFREKSKGHDLEINLAISKALEAAAQMSEELGGYGTAYQIRSIKHKHVKSIQIKGKEQ